MCNPTDSTSQVPLRLINAGAQLRLPLGALSLPLDWMPLHHRVPSMNQLQLSYWGRMLFHCSEPNKKQLGVLLLPPGGGMTMPPNLICPTGIFLTCDHFITPHEVSLTWTESKLFWTEIKSNKNQDNQYGKLVEGSTLLYNNYYIHVCWMAIRAKWTKLPVSAMFAFSSVTFVSIVSSFSSSLLFLW